MGVERLGNRKEFVELHANQIKTENGKNMFYRLGEMLSAFYKAVLKGAQDPSEKLMKSNGPLPRKANTSTDT